VAGHGTSRVDRPGVVGGAGHRSGGQRRRSPEQRGRPCGHEQTEPGRVLEAVHRPGRLEADSAHHAVLFRPARQRVLRATVLLGGRAERLPRPVGRHHSHRIPVLVPRRR